jgi:chromosome segregation ATPase
MGLFTSKIFAGVLAGGFTLAGAGLLFTGHNTLQDANAFVKDSSNKLVQFESNEGSLLSKLNLVKTDANSKIATANGVIADKKQELADLTAKKEALEGQITSLQSDITSLQGQLDSTKGDLDSTKKALSDKTAQYDAKVAELAKANATIKQGEQLLQYAYQKAQEGDKLVSQLEGELKKANDDVAETGKVVDQAKQDTKDSQPLTSDEVNAVDTTTSDVTQ